MENSSPYFSFVPRHCRRLDSLTAQRIEVGVVFLMMLGEADAREYLARNGIANALAERVLSQARNRRGETDGWLAPE